MTSIKCACVQLRSSDIIEANIQNTSMLVREAAEAGAQFIATPEMTNFLDIRPGGTRGKAVDESEDMCLQAMRELAKELGVWLLVGSLAVRVDEEKFANRSVLIGPDGGLAASYDKIHMFDVDIGDGQSYQESDAYQPGDRAVLVETPFAAIGMSVCYDVRFGALYRLLAQAGAQIITVPAAFTRVTGEAHWHVLLRARAIENGCFIMAPAQGGKHADGRETYGHSLIINPWGEIIAEGDDAPGVVMADIDLTEVETARRRIPSLRHHRDLRLERFEAWHA